MTSATTQAIANTNEPAYGTILSDKIVNNSDSVSLSSLFSPLLEPEIMFIAKKTYLMMQIYKQLFLILKSLPALRYQTQDIKIGSRISLLVI